MKYDVIIIGGGVSGCATARELSRYRVKACVLEREEDVCCGTSKANSGIVHAGHDAWPGTLMAQLNVRGNALMEPLSEELDFEFRRNGSMVVCTEEEKRGDLQKLLERGEKNGVPDLRILEREEALAMEPNLTEDTVAVLYAPTGGIVCPFGLNIALAENAYTNGVEFYFDTEVTRITRRPDGFLLETTQGEYVSDYVVNAAGVYADVFHNMVSQEKMNITPRRGEYMLLDKTVGGHVSHTIFRLPDELGKGVLVTPTVHGNLLVGPTAQNLQEKEAVNTTQEGLRTIRDRAGKSVRGIPFRQVITSFAGLRACAQTHDFIIQEAPDAPGFIDCAGIASPGLTSAPAIGEMVAEMLRTRMNLEANPEFCGRRKGILNPAKLPLEERNRLIEREPAYGQIICRCEMVTEGEIVDAVRRPLGAKSLDGVKRRTRAGMGRCQAGFCSPKTMEILARERGILMEAVTKSGGDSTLICGINKDIWQGDE
ncbi:NAD(P)/FAD-dependent oxidoreductase [Bariatricus massiliensis]|uniref:NAD(P)/FAD-dependent oxidoreductase n=1 Tax=Bariatricus massiliensis TaxID=1745713 RepID=A0ABS8DI52_9FIRM|nr:NAD(P)/FAD-dependent oxidoreductase [Bariatricus massiliensis]MCB7304677.1 NAD(P)/FAD-dependent oxidoreductase [Bariatricus massiliensis]MCB7374828.1 NAD(P)/FAD-dependent oxidoreductase [Bariatricus massiliensis]MCB7388045.1 NAD(P)/FAD-dependent oxidoreductase [Bariatricus massiliensis]MCB7411993.1 NAD(P)/FAD-dependent oxidoreductase [Bariatricus massiliensis]MCQ5254216.1 NAD(P)/FAD-dependent oxidoreductase [Bariatricus massiliensis]